MCISLEKISSSNWTVALLFFLFFLWAPPGQAQVPSFNGLGDLPGGVVGSSARDISADGSEVMVRTYTRAYLWTRAPGSTVAAAFAAFNAQRLAPWLSPSTHRIAASESSSM